MTLNKNIVLILTVGLAISFSSPAQALWLSGYDYRKEITIDHTKIDSALSDFPLAVILSDTTNIVDGNDVKFTLSDGSTKLDYEIEKYATNNAVYWVNIPSVSAGTDTTFYMYYGKTGDTDESTSAVWDSNYTMVQHLDEISGTHYDSTSNDNDAAEYISSPGTQNAAGKIDGADYFDGSNDYLTVSKDADPIGATTISFWIKTSASQHDKFIYGTGVGGSTAGQYVRVWSNKVDWTVDNATTGRPIDAFSTTSTINNGLWHNIVFTWDGTTNTNAAKVFFDGVLENQTTAATTRSGASTYDISIGRFPAGNSGYNLNGTLDEFRISDTVRSSAWITASYYSESNNLLAFGNEEEGVIPEPASLLLLGFGVTGILIFKKRVGA